MTKRSDDAGKREVANPIVSGEAICQGLGIEAVTPESHRGIETNASLLRRHWTILRDRP